MTPIVLLIAFGIGSFIRAILVKDQYKMNFVSILTNIVIGIIVVFVVGSATKN